MEEEIKILKTLDCGDDIELKSAIKKAITALSERQADKERIKDYKNKIRNLECKIIQQKEQINGLRSKYHVDAWLEEDYIPKSKLREKIDSFDPELQRANSMGDNEIKERIWCAVATLEELLQEKQEG